MLDTLGNQVQVIGVALGKEGTEDFEAAKLSISCLPGKPVLMGYPHMGYPNSPYAGTDGFKDACLRAIVGGIPIHRSINLRPFYTNLTPAEARKKLLNPKK
ncbi:MAG: hypothetical protein PHU42_03350 [Patescibacteria group bacterium]|nr:hypothetical protein [Patescibacteria group bacterium]